MSRTISHRPLWPTSSYIALLLFILILTSTTLQRAGAIPFPDFVPNTNGNETTESSTGNSTEDSVNSSTDNTTEITPSTDIYVVKAVVYEIGILTDTDNTTSSESSESTERQEKIDISLFSSPQEDEFF